MEKRFAEAASKQNEANSDSDGEKKHHHHHHHSGRHDKSKHMNFQDLIDEDHEKKILPRNEVIRRLRDRGEPIRLFGETDADTAKRLNIIETSEPKENGMRNDFKDAMEKSEMESLNQIMNSMENGSMEPANAAEDLKEEAIDFNEIIVSANNDNSWETL